MSLHEGENPNSKWVRYDVTDAEKAESTGDP